VVHAQLPEAQRQCFERIASAGRGFVGAKLSLLRSCTDADLKDGSCPAPDPGAIAALEDKLAASIARECALPPASFPGPCPDLNPSDGFTLSDLVACMGDSHEGVVDDIQLLLYDPTTRTEGPLRSAAWRCQKTIAKYGANFAVALLRAVQRCENLRLRYGWIIPEVCWPYPWPTRTERRARHHIDRRCTDAQIAQLRVCVQDQTTVDAALYCLIEAIRDLVDDLIDYEYARHDATCGDAAVNMPGEECDGTDNGACPGNCGEPTGAFPCLCLSKPRQLVREHANADLDFGWSGRGHDQGVAEGGYLTDLSDCDRGGICLVGPSCSLPPHAPCAVAADAPPDTTGDSLCVALGQGTCRKERTAVGPHCFMDVQKKCSIDAICSEPGDFCVKTRHGPPLPLSGGGVSVCLVHVFSEDVVGTTDVVTGESTVRLRENAIMHVGTQLNKPCPVCGGFCAGNRERCESDGDCVATGSCITDLVCSDGPSQDRPCRATPPFGGPTAHFGTTSVDCPPDPTVNISGSGLDILQDPRTTGTTTLVPSFPCAAPEFAGNACSGGAEEGRPCGEDSDCPSGACSPQCFCPGQAAPNDCHPACVRGSQDAAPCVADSECPGGFCHPGDCRVNPGDTDSAQEGVCTAGPVRGTCSTTQFRSCAADADCELPSCPYCQSGESCAFELLECFVNSGIIRRGAAGLPDRITAATFCIPPTANQAVNHVAGLPAPGALTQPETTIEVGIGSTMLTPTRRTRGPFTSSMQGS